MEKSTDRFIYESPITEIVESYPEGVLCASGVPVEQTEPLDEIFGQW